MRATFSLLWKEYREQRWFLIAALVIFCGFPLIEASGRYFRPPMQYTASGPVAMKPEFSSDAAGGLVLGLGGLLAIFVAIGSTTRDLRDELHVFWRSRPIGVGTWLGIKYVAGLATVLTACTIPMLLQFWMVADTGRHWAAAEVGGIVGIHTFAVVLIFSIAFLLGCLVRHATHAALLSLAAALLVYFLPVVVGALAPLSAFNLMNQEAFTLERNATPNPAGWTFFLPAVPGRWRVIIEPRDWTIFTATMLGGSIVATASALLAVRRDWRLAADRQAMHWSLGGVAILLFGATAFQVGSNIEPKQQFDLPQPRRAIANLAFDGRRGVAMMWELDGVRWYDHTRVQLCTIEATPQGVRYGPLVSPKEKINTPVTWEPNVLFWRPEQPDRAYLIAQQSENVVRNGISFREVRFRALLTIDLTGASADPVLHRLDLAPQLPLKGDLRAYHHGNTLFVDGEDRTVEIDLMDPDGPTPRRTLRETHMTSATRPVRIDWLQLWEQTDAATGRVSIDVRLIGMGNLPPRNLLESRLAMARSNDRCALDGDLFVRATDEAISTYRLVHLDASIARFELLGRCEFTPLERLMGTYITNMSVIDGRVYARGRGLTVIDVTDPTRPRHAGHFALPSTAGARATRLASGDVLLVADRAYVLAPPERLE